ncbi:hypothetical protein BDZ97DRAFT_1764383 [Flammula alnicola]|nr:hypothetical protein BDZ97DRAFT_1764383 [Flammula alnicola]
MRPLRPTARSACSATTAAPRNMADDLRYSAPVRPTSPKGDYSGLPKALKERQHRQRAQWQTTYILASRRGAHGHKLMVLAMCRNRTHNLSDGAQPPLKATQ